ncbi:MAG TPA: hypothetical protein VNQ74_03345, partial [Burkholderiaceae bacterium]|nr:hypothetical protein [Burkholderiaceae bacterium]
SRSNYAYPWRVLPSHPAHGCPLKTVCVPFMEMNVESYRRREAIKKKRGPGRPALYATPAKIGVD